MLTITIPARRFWDESREEFIYTKERTLQLEHSLVSLSKWESKWKKPFFTDKPKTSEEIVDYIRCMTITQNVDPKVYWFIDQKILNTVEAYIDDPMTATTFSKEENESHNKEVITAEIIYHWMIAYQIPMECQKWHLNRLITLVRVCGIKNAPPKQRSQKELIQHHRAVNKARRARKH